jgi:hypothetical protein
MIGVAVGRIKRPNQDYRIQLFSDGNDDYTYVLPEFFETSCMDYAQLVKIREKGTLIGKEKRIIFGAPDLHDIETTDVENFNGILRERIGRMVRKTKCYSKRKTRLQSAYHLFQFYWNFMSHIRRGVTPAMIEGMSETPWSWKEFFYVRLSNLN